MFTMKSWKVLLALPALFTVSLSAGDGRAIPGITAKDQFPRACVDCHVKQADGTDLRFSEVMKKWVAGADAKTVAAMQGFVPKGTTLKGKHPPVAAIQDIPGACFKCHRTKIAPPFAPLIHGIHLSRGAKGRFVTMFQGECTHCHKLNLTTGVWTLPSGAPK